MVERDLTLCLDCATGGATAEDSRGKLSVVARQRVETTSHGVDSQGMAYLYTRRSPRLTVRLLPTNWPLLMLVVAAPLGVLILGHGSDLVVGVILLLLGLFGVASTLWLSVRADTAGITVRNPFRSYRVPWDEVVLIASVESGGYWWPSHIEVTRGSTWALPDGYPFTIAATVGLGDSERRKIVDDLVAQGKALGFDIRTASGHQSEVWSTLVAEPEAEPRETEGRMAAPCSVGGAGGDSMCDLRSDRCAGGNGVLRSGL